MPTLESQLARRFNDIGVEQSDMIYHDWSKFWNDGAVLVVMWTEKPDCSVKVVGLLKEMPEMK